MAPWLETASVPEAAGGSMEDAGCCLRRGVKMKIRTATKHQCVGRAFELYCSSSGSGQIKEGVHSIYTLAKVKTVH